MADTKPPLPPRLPVAQEGEKPIGRSHVADIAYDFARYYVAGGGCSNCGGLPHTDTCFVGRFVVALALDTLKEPATPPPALPTLETELTTARLAVNDWHACGTADELNQWRKAQHRLIDAAKAVGHAEAPQALLALQDENATLGEMLDNSYQARRELQASIDSLEAREAALLALVNKWRAEAEVLKSLSDQYPAPQPESILLFTAAWVCGEAALKKCADNLLAELEKRS